MKKLILFLLSLFLITGCSTSSVPSNTDQFTSLREIHFIDTGNSDCTLIHGENFNVLIDGGDRDDKDMLVDYLKSLNITTIDYLISTHPDADHCGSLATIVNNFTIKNAFVCNGKANTKTYQSFIQALSNIGLNPSVPLENNTFYLDDDISLTFYNTKSKANNSNDLSLITLYQDHQKRFLFTGDASYDVIENYTGQIGTIDVLKVSHHGSYTGTSESMIWSLQPKIAVIECGKDNSYGHPHQEVLDILNAYDIEILRTDQLGTIILNTDGNTIEQSTFSAKTTNTEKYIGNTSTLKYHLASCDHLPSKDHQIVFNSTKEATQAGYEACKKCFKNT